LDLTVRPDPQREHEQLRLCGGCAERIDAMPKKPKRERGLVEVLGGYCDACGVSRPGSRLVVVENVTGKGPDHLRVCDRCEDRVRALPQAPAQPPTVQDLHAQLRQLQAARDDAGVGRLYGSVTPVGRR
jgi:hypothetical protein